ncbi:MAG: hypothetical protein MUE54_02290, partial [Anaerolineae bacterium]|nr:hypothetical protein [Anaerolineae bacterium]
MSKIIISYNPDDTKAASNRLNDYLVSRFGAGIVTLGAETLITSPADADMVVQNADSIVVMIGNKWAELGAYRNPDDLNRALVASALRLNKKIFPVLVSGASIPADLPSDIGGLANLITMPFTAQTVTDDANRIADALVKVALSAQQPNKPLMEQPTFMSAMPNQPPPPQQNPFGAPPPYQQPPSNANQPPAYVPKPPKPPVEPTAIPMIPDVTRFVRPLFERFGTLPMLLAPSAVFFGIWFFFTSVT